MRIRFYIEKRKAEDGSMLIKDRPVFMTVAFHGKRILISSGKKLDHHWWDAEKQRVRPEHPEALVLNTWFDNMRATAMQAWKAVSSAEVPDVKSFREAYKRLKPKFSTGFFDVFFQFMEEGSQRWNRSTYSKVRTFYTHLKEFEEMEGIVLTFSGIDKSFLDRFREFYARKGNKHTTTMKAVNTLVWFLNWASEQQYNIYTDYKTFYKEMGDAQERSHVRDEVYLEWNELMSLLDLSLDEPRQERARDIFCFMCLTGLRYGEVRNLHKEDVLENRIIVKKKSSKTRTVPLNRFSGEIISHYDNKYYRNNAALPVMSLVTLNKYIKIIVGQAGLKKSVEVTAGMASTTFIMNALKLDIPAPVISSYTGVNKDRRVKILKQQLAMEEMKKFDSLPH